MIGYTTNISLDYKEIKTTFCQETRTFSWDNRRVTFKDAMIVAAEDMANQITFFLSKVAAHVEKS
jgi:hypothetical protein